MPERVGLSAALPLPLRADMSIDLPRLVEHAASCLAAGCRTVTVFGTTGEGVSVEPAARAGMLGALLGAGIAPERIVGGVAATSAREAVAQGRMLAEAGVGALLLAPPFYYKDLGEAGLLAWLSEVIRGLGTEAPGTILYNIPSVTAVPLSPDLVGRLRTAFPGAVIGIKDSSGDMATTRAFLEAHGDLSILVGDERLLAEGVRLGAEGSISGLANIIPGDIAGIIAERRERTHVTALVEAVLRHPVTPAVKTLMVHRTGHPDWLHCRPPLEALEPAAAEALTKEFDRLMSGA